MSELPLLPLVAHLTAEAVRRQVDPAAPPEPDRPRRSFRPVRQARAIAATVLHRVARAVAPAPECSPGPRPAGPHRPPEPA
jgi:hypothetical protein